VNDSAEYERARAGPAPNVTVRCLGTLARDGRRDRPLAVRAATLGAAAAAAGVELDRDVVAALNGSQVAPDPRLPLAAGDAVQLATA
jgi:molybdopterin-guanine dinucleotide biosynthesis protein A